MSRFSLRLQEEKEKRLEEIFEADLDNLNENRYAPKEDLPEEGAVGLAGKKTRETLTAADSIIDALDMAEAELTRIDQHKEDKKSGKYSDFQPNIMLRGLSPSDYVLSTISSVHTNDLEYALLSLTFSDSLKLLSYLKEWSIHPDKVELVCRIATVLLQTHHNQLVATTAARPLLAELKGFLYKKVKECKDMLGFNIAAMDHIKEMMALRSDALFRDAKAKLMEIRSKQAKQHEKVVTHDERKRKKQKNSRESKPGA